MASQNDENDNNFANNQPISSEKIANDVERQYGEKSRKRFLTIFENHRNIVVFGCYQPQWHHGLSNLQNSSKQKILLSDSVGNTFIRKRMMVGRNVVKTIS